MKKRAQVSVFILLGIIVIAVIGAVAYFYGDQIQNFTRPGTLDASRLEPLKSFVTLCMEESVNEDLINLKKNSGYFNKISSTVIYSGFDINEYFLENKDVTVTRTDADNGIIYRIVTDNEEDGFVFGVKNE